MKQKTIADIVHLVKNWSRSHCGEVIETILVGGQAELMGCDTLRPGSDVDLVITIRDNADSRTLMFELAAVGLEQSVLFHPLFMTRKEWNEKMLLDRYRKMLKSGKRIFPEDMSPTGRCT